MRLNPPNFEETRSEMFDGEMSVPLEPSLNLEKTISNREICSSCFRSLFAKRGCNDHVGYVE